MKNLEKVWKAEQAKTQEEQKLNDLKHEIEEEKNREDLKRIGQASGVLENSDDKKLEWMYKSSTELVDREEYLLGRSVDKTFEIMHTEEQQREQKNLVGIKVSANHVEHECIPFSIRTHNNLKSTEQVDLHRKILEDPLMVIRQKEMESRRKLLENPVKLKELHRILKSDKKLKKTNRHSKMKSEKKKKDLKSKLKKRKKNSKHDTSSKNSSDLDTGSGTASGKDLDKELEKRYKKLLSKEEKLAGLTLTKLLDAKYETISKELDKAVKLKEWPQKSNKYFTANVEETKNKHISQSSPERRIYRREHHDYGNKHEERSISRSASRSGRQQIKKSYGSRSGTRSPLNRNNDKPGKKEAWRMQSNSPTSSRSVFHKSRNEDEKRERFNSRERARIRNPFRTNSDSRRIEESRKMSYSHFDHYGEFKKKTEERKKYNAREGSRSWSPSVRNIAESRKRVEWRKRSGSFSSSRKRSPRWNVTDSRKNVEWRKKSRSFSSSRKRSPRWNVNETRKNLEWRQKSRSFSSSRKRSPRWNMTESRKNLEWRKKSRSLSSSRKRSPRSARNVTEYKRKEERGRNTRSYHAPNVPDFKNKERRKKSRSHTRSRSRSRSHRIVAKSRKKEVESHTGITDHSSNLRQSKSAAEEKEKRLQEMMVNAAWHDKERTKSVRKHREADAQEEARNRAQKFDKEFANKQFKAVMLNHTSVESRIRSNMKNIQRTSAAMNSNFTRK